MTEDDFEAWNRAAASYAKGRVRLPDAEEMRALYDTGMTPAQAIDWLKKEISIRG